MSLISAPSFWYVPCFGSLVIIGLLWSWKPSLAASLSIGPLLAFAALFQYLSGLRLAIAAMSLILSALLVVATLDNFRMSRLPLLASLSLLVVSFATDRMFTNRITVRAYQMSVALDGNAPWGQVGAQWTDGSPPIVLYRPVGHSYCYDAFQSQELHDRLAGRHRDTVRVEYNISEDFGTERAYNVRSVDGLLLNDGKDVVRNFEWFGGQILRSESGTTDSCR
jgi:hypothetical protein